MLILFVVINLRDGHIQDFLNYLTQSIKFIDVMKIVFAVKIV